MDLGKALISCSAISSPTHFICVFSLSLFEFSASNSPENPKVMAHQSYTMRSVSIYVKNISVCHFYSLDWAKNIPIAARQLCGIGGGRRELLLRHLGHESHAMISSPLVCLSWMLLDQPNSWVVLHLPTVLKGSTRNHQDESVHLQQLLVDLIYRTFGKIILV